MQLLVENPDAYPARGSLPRSVFRRAHVFLAVGALSLSFAGCAKEPVEKLTSSPIESSTGATVPQGSDSGGVSDRGGESPRPPVEQDDLPEESRGLQPPAKSNFPAIDEHTEEGAYAAAAYYWTAHYYALATGDTEPLKEILDLEVCDACQAVVDSIEGNAEKARVTPLPTITDEQFALSKQENTWIVRYEFRRSGTVTYEKGKPVVERGEADVEAYIELEWRENRWYVVNEAVEYYDAV